MKVSISLTERQLKFVDDKVEAGWYPTRSAAIAAAIRRLQEKDLFFEYLEAFAEEDEDAALWDSTVGDGMGDGEE